MSSIITRKKNFQVVILVAINVHQLYVFSKWKVRQLSKVKDVHL